MKKLNRVVIVRDTQGNDTTLEYSVNQYETLTEAIEAIGESRALGILNQMIEAEMRAMWRIEAKRK